MDTTAVLPQTRLGSVGLGFAAFAVAVAIYLIATETGGPTAWSFVWAPTLVAGVIELVAVIRKHERSVLGFVALVPLGLFLVLLLMEITGLME